MTSPRRASSRAPSSRTHRRTSQTPSAAGLAGTAPSPQALSGDWLSLTDLGRVYGVSAVHTGKILQAAGLRLADGDPSPEALAAGLAQRQHSGQHRQALWHRQGCAPHLEGQGLTPQNQRNLVGLWADLLAALQQGSPGIATSAEEMAGDIPGDLVQPVNRELRQRGCDFQVQC
jgi:hypothetical protein